MTEFELRHILSQNLKRYRNSRKLSQAELAEKVDISIPFLSDIENGRKWVSPATLVKFASALNIEPYELFKSALPLEDSSILDKYIDEVGTAINQTLYQVRGYFSEDEIHPKK
jgi:transcriptional regulator with XRE-family HTH domain